MAGDAIKIEHGDGPLSEDAAKAVLAADVYAKALQAAYARGRADAESDTAATFQARVQPWLMECFGPEIAADRQERNHRFIEEALELVQACGATRSEAHQLVEYVYDRPSGDPVQEAGGVMVTLAALCLAHGMDMHAAGETELARVWTKVEAIRAKQAAKPRGSALPQYVPDTAARIAQARREERERCAREAEGQETTWKHWFGDEDTGLHAEGRSFASYWIARRIRALADPAATARDAPASDPHPLSNCLDCGLPYSDPGFADLVVSDDAWARMSPTGHEGGLLCPTCMVRAAHKAGVETAARFRSGPFVDPPPLAASPAEVAAYAHFRRILLSDEAVEAAAIGLHELGPHGGVPPAPWLEQPSAVRKWRRKQARAALEAAVKVMERRDGR